MNIALVIIDMQNDFVLPEAPLCVKGAQATVPTIQKLLDRARAEGWRVIHDCTIYDVRFAARCWC